MHAIVVDGDEVHWREVPTPDPGPGQVRIRVAAAGVNRADLLQRAGRYPPPPGASPILGLECSGVIDAVGPGVGPWRIGDPVCALLAGGGYAEAVVVPAGQLLRVPSGCTVVDAAALPEVFATALLALVREGQVARGDAVLVHAGAGGVGSAAIQLARELGATAVATAGRAAKVERCLALGASVAVDRRAGSWREALAEHDLDRFDVIVDPVGGSYLEDNQAVLAVGGRLVTLGLMGGSRATVDLARLLLGRQRLIGTVLRSRDPADKASLVADLADRVWPAVAAGRIVPVIDSVLPIAEVEQAHRRMAANDTVGKILLKV